MHGGLGVTRQAAVARRDGPQHVDTRQQARHPRPSQVLSLIFRYEPLSHAGDFGFCHHVIIVSKPVQSALFLDGERSAPRTGPDAGSAHDAMYAERWGGLAQLNKSEQGADLRGL